MKVTRVEKITYWVCMGAAVAIILAIAAQMLPARPDRFSAINPAAAMSPLMGFSADARVNAGDAKALDALPGVGEVIAQRIIDTREDLDGFRLPEDLLLVKGIGEKTLEKIMATLDAQLVMLKELDE